jgi:hypothetical protein
MRIHLELSLRRIDTKATQFFQDHCLDKWLHSVCRDRVILSLHIGIVRLTLIIEVINKMIDLEMTANPSVTTKVKK